MLIEAVKDITLTAIIFHQQFNGYLILVSVPSLLKFSTQTQTGCTTKQQMVTRS